MDELTRRITALEDIEEIKSLKARYFRCVDAKDWAAVEGVFWPDAEIAASTASGSTASAFVASLRGLADNVTTFHAGHAPEIELGHDGTARGRWAMSFYMQWPGASGPEAIQGFRRYEDLYRKDNGEWRIAEMKITAVDADPQGAAAGSMPRRDG